MKWGIRKSEYRAMNRKERKAVRKEYYKTPEGKVKKATMIGTIAGGPLVGITAGLITSMAVKKTKSISKEETDKGKQIVDRYKKTKIEIGNKTKNTLKNTKTNKHETAEQKIKKLMAEGKTNPKANYIFDQNGNLMMVYYDN